MCCLLACILTITLQIYLIMHFYQKNILNMHSEIQGIYLDIINTQYCANTIGILGHTNPIEFKIVGKIKYKTKLHLLPSIQNHSVQNRFNSLLIPHYWIKTVRLTDDNNGSSISTKNNSSISRISYKGNRIIIVLLLIIGIVVRVVTANIG